MMSQQQLSQLRPWHRAVVAAWLARELSDSPRRHPNLAARIFRRYAYLLDIILGK